MKMRLIYFYAILAIAFFSCSTPEKKVEEPLQYSEQTEKTFNSIETEEAQILERYRQMRMKNWDNYVGKKRYESPAADYARKRQREAAPIVRSRPVPQAPPPPPELTEEQLKAIEIEINQRKSIFCMKAKTVNRFDSEADCQAFVENNHYECIKQFGERSKSLVGCLKGKLR